MCSTLRLLRGFLLLIVSKCVRAFYVCFLVPPLHDATASVSGEAPPVLPVLPAIVDLVVTHVMRVASHG